ncbi:MAG: class I adenylate-forming enzyme family protein [Kofleriaceae bacterium]
MLVPDLLREQAAKVPDKTAIIVDGIAQMTYGEWEAASNRLARALVARGVTPGTRVGLMFTNNDAHRFSIAYMAVHKAGGVGVPLNIRLAPNELKYIAEHSEMGVLLYGSDNDGLDAVRAAAAPTSTPKLVMGVRAQDDVMASQDSSTFQVERSDNDLADILYTSGTTGQPKGVACEHGNITFMTSQSVSQFFKGLTMLHAVPVFTFAGAHAMMLIPLRGGMTTVIQPKFDAARYLELVEQHKVAMAFTVPSMVLLMLEQAKRGLTSLKLLLYGTAPMPEMAIKQLPELFPSAMLVNMYGLTEGGTMVCSLPPHEAQKRPTSVGKPVPPAEIKIVGEDGTQMPAGEPGEIFLRSPVKQRSYYKDEAATQATWTNDGWLRTGDIGYVDADGYLFLVDRKKDLIIRGGFNITAAEVENALLEHPKVREAAVIGVPHKVLGEDTKAFVVIASGEQVSPAELETFCRERLADYKVPRNYEFITALPRNALGKVLKRDLRDGAKS